MTEKRNKPNRTRTQRIEFWVTPAEKELIDFSAKQLRRSHDEGTATVVRENEVKTALSVAAGVLHLSTGEVPEFSPAVLELFTPDMRAQYELSPEERKKKYEEWMEEVKSRREKR